ncbi:MAG: aminotransferase class V-fold PLP-dependent enzyme [Candidatus Aenigmatarchaeota archaeon]
MNVDNIRKDFPLLQQVRNGKPLIYFDNACVTLRPKQVINAMNEYYENFPVCTRSSYRLGALVTEKYEKSRENIAKFLNAKTNEIVFTRNTTEGINLVANSLNLHNGDIVLTTDKEHNSNLLPWQVLTNRGIRHEIVFSNRDNTFNMEEFESKMNKNVKLVSMVHTSNLDGYTIPAEDIIKIAHDFGALVMLDGAQSVPHKKMNVKKMDCDFLAFSGHKALGPSGIGCLYGKHELLETLGTFMLGGDTVSSSTYETHKLLEPPEKFEAGLQNYAGAIGLAEALNYLDKIGLDNVEKHEQRLNTIITDSLFGIADIIGPSVEMRSGITSFNINGIGYHEIALMLDELANIMIRSGQHCVHSWFNAHKIDGSARVSLYLYNTEEECKVFNDTISKIIKLK